MPTITELKRSLEEQGFVGEGYSELVVSLSSRRVWIVVVLPFFLLLLFVLPGPTLAVGVVEDADVQECVILIFRTIE